VPEDTEERMARPGDGPRIGRGQGTFGSQDVAASEPSPWTRDVAKAETPGGYILHRYA